MIIVGLAFCGAVYVLYTTWPRNENSPQPPERAKAESKPAVEASRLGLNAAQLRRVANAVRVDREAKQAEECASKLQDRRRLFAEQGPLQVTEVFNSISSLCQDAARDGKTACRYYFRVQCSDPDSDPDWTLLLPECVSEDSKVGTEGPYTEYGRALVARLEHAGFRVEYRAGRYSRGSLGTSHWESPSLQITW